MSGPRNTLADLHNHLFEQLERLNDDELKGEFLEEEIKRSNAITSVATNIIKNGNLVLSAQKLKENPQNADTKVPRILTGESDEI